MGSYYFFVDSNLEKKWKILEKWLFFRGDMAGLGKYSMGRYGRIGVYRVNIVTEVAQMLWFVYQRKVSRARNN